ncbi:MAG: hypothetical protein IPO95_11875 [Rhodanobacteraceae bacterium]|jgi:hypothetical protein|nr:hypothetical protein [Rhodanobacteraceae bacterium]MBL0042457.1 hypothetical protein [Xanthomonadales bacterium]MBP6077295.1 hypothetical protein [Xanthomonadales bacterium]MBP7623435.1 hypothetical protein [Xanthomonadales bacterium]
MPDDRFPIHADHDDHALRSALQALPLVAPKRSVFAELERELATASPPMSAAMPRRRRGAWIALAATLVAAVVGVRLLHSPVAAPTPVTSASPSANTLALIAQSQQLDGLLATLDARSVPIDASAAMASAELEDLIGLTDLQLNAVTRDDEAQALWSRRVDLMSRLAATRAGSRYDTLSDNGGAYLQDANYRVD